MSDSVPQKHCPRCNRDLPATTEYFHRARTKKDGLLWRCKSCQHDAVAAKAASNPDFYQSRYQKQHARELAQSLEEQHERLARQAQYMRERRARMRQPGICTSCLIRPAEPGHRCDHCISATWQWVKKNPNHIRTTHKQTRDNLRQQVLEAYGNKCACCGEFNSAFLSIDHINGGGTQHRRSLNGHFYLWLRKNGFPQDEFQLLCHNCNFAKHVYHVCPHHSNGKPQPCRKVKPCLIALRQEVLSAYGGKCACCGESRHEFLAVDHVNNDGAKHRRILSNRGGREFYKWLRQSGFPQEGFQLLCFNCNWAKYACGVCPHQNDAS